MNMDAQTRWLSISLGLLFCTSAIGQDCVDNIDCDDGDACTFDRCVDTACTKAPAAYGDVVGAGLSCGPDDDVQLGDLHVVVR